MKLLILITSRLQGGLEVAQLWQERGAPGVTMLRGYGIQSLRQAVERGEIELPRVVVSMAAAMAAVIDNMEHTGVVVISAVEDTMVDEMVHITNEVLGDLTEPNTGVLLQLAIEQAYGVRATGPR